MGGSVGAGRVHRGGHISALRPLLACLLGSLAVSGCGGRAAPQSTEGQILVAATIGMIADIVGRVGGDRVAVTGLMGPGVDPHLYKASAGDVRTLSNSEMIFYNGLHLEAAMSEVLEQMNRTTRTVAVTDGIPRDRLLTPPEFQGLHDPHVWFDVSMWMSAVEVVGEALADFDPEHAAEYRTRASETYADLEELDTWVREQIVIREANASFILIITTNGYKSKYSVSNCFNDTE